MKAIWNNRVIAESSHTLEIEGTHYFPAESVKRDYLIDSATTTLCPWKGTADYYSVRVDGETNTNAAWCYHNPKPAAAKIKGRFAFWRGVTVLKG